MNPATNDSRSAYTVREFVAHFDHFSTAPGAAADPNFMIRYFVKHYPVGTEGRDKLNRFAAAFDYLTLHLQDFREFVILGEHRKALVALPLVLALGSYFTQAAWQRLPGRPDAIPDPPPKAFLALAKFLKNGVSA